LNELHHMLVSFQRNVQCIRSLRCANNFIIIIIIIIISYFNTRFSPSEIPKYQNVER